MCRKWLLTFAALCLTASIWAGTAISLDRNWQFSYGGDISPEARRIVDLPHTWNYDAVSVNSSHLRGVANYIRSVEIPAQWKNKRVYLRFAGINSEALLLVNGHFAGSHEGGYTGFTVEITDLVNFGEPNSLWIRVNNSPQLDVMPVGGGFNVYGGMHRGVELIVTEKTHISLSESGSDGVLLRQKRVTAERAEVEAVVHIDSSDGKTGSYTVAVEISHPVSDSVVYRRESKVRVEREASVTIPVTIERPVLWNGVKSPFMYKTTVRLSNDRGVVDSLTLPLGLRYYAVSADGGFSLNGEPYRIQGVTYFSDRSGRGTAMRVRDYEEDMATMLEMGVNAVRMTNYPADPYFFDLCDRHGIIVWSEIPLTGQMRGSYDGYLDSPRLRESCVAQLTEMIMQNYNHPSVLFWGLFSNLSMRDDSPVAFIRELNALAKRLDGTRLTVASSNQDGDINFITDLIAWSQYMGWMEGEVDDLDLWLDQLKSEWGNLKSGIGEYGAGGSAMYAGDSLRRPDPRGKIHPGRWQTEFHEMSYRIFSSHKFLWGSFIHTMFDYGSAGYVGGDIPGVSDFGLVTYDRRDRKDAYYFYKANWNGSDPFVHIAGRRWTPRTGLSHSVKVYSNRPSVELFINGESLGEKRGSHGIFTWTGVSFIPGTNRIEASGGGALDTVWIEIGERY